MTAAITKSADIKADLDLEWLLKVRTVVARIGEMDLARWWNSNGQLGPQGASVMRRGLTGTHHLAQVRSVCLVAAARCAQIVKKHRSGTPGYVRDQPVDLVPELGRQPGSRSAPIRTPPRTNFRVLHQSIAVISVGVPLQCLFTSDQRRLAGELA